MFQVTALDYAPFAPLFALDEAALAAHRAQRHIAGEGAPCRVTLEDARPGETLLLVNYLHQPADTPYHAAHAIYVREGAVRAAPAPGEIPPALASRTLSLRAFDAAGNIVAAGLADGRDAAPVIDALLAEPAVAYLHAHYAKYGCYAARIDRAPPSPRT